MANTILIDELEAIVADGETGAESPSPRYSLCRPDFHSVRDWALVIIDIAASGEKVGIAESFRICRMTLGDGGVSDIDIAVGAVVVIDVAATGVIDLDGLLFRLRNAGGTAPVPSVTADFAGAEGVVEGDELAGEGEMVGREVLGKDNERGLTVAAVEIAEDLIVSLVFFHDINDVVDFGVEIRHQVLGRGYDCASCSATGSDHSGQPAT